MNMVKQFYFFLRDLVISRRIIFELTRKDFQFRYLGSFLGLTWAFIHPAATIAVLWFVIEVGFRSTPVNNYPSILWLMAGLIPWFFFSDCIGSATNSIIENSLFVKKVVFRVSILPIIKINSALIIHICFIGVLFLMFLVYGHVPDIYHLQIVYYLFSMIVFLLGISWITSSVTIFLKDVGQVIMVLLQFGFWLTPILWPYKMVSEEYLIWIKLNPAYYLIEGYRGSFIYKTWFWNDLELTIYFWVITLIVFFTGALLFKKLRPHFADML
jgi:ABC-type polysaccharide/polyol phosphate export permease